MLQNFIDFGFIELSTQNRYLFRNWTLVIEQQTAILLNSAENTVASFKDINEAWQHFLVSY